MVIGGIANSGNGETWNANEKNVWDGNHLNGKNVKTPDKNNNVKRRV